MRAARCWSSADLLAGGRQRLGLLVGSVADDAFVLDPAARVVPSADDQHRAVGQMDDLVGHAANEQEGGQVAAAMGAEDDHARLVIPGGRDDEPPRRP
jgi:hypothetical protein